MQLTIQTPNYRSTITSFSRDSILVERIHDWKSGGIELDTFCRFWAFGMATIERGEIGMGRKGQILNAEGNIGVFLPPFSIVEWHLAPGTRYWKALLSVEKCPLEMPREAVMFKLPDASFPQSLPEVFELIGKAAELIPVGKEERSSAVARRTKASIDTLFDSDRSIASIANELGISHAVLSRAFKQAYGLSPIAYMNQLRMMESVRLMMLEQSSVSTSAFEAGFRDLSRFNRQFKSKYLSVPSNFLKK